MTAYFTTKCDRWSVIKKCDNFITKCDDYYEGRQNNVRVSEIWNQLASSPPRSAARVLTSYITTGIRSFLLLWYKRGYTTKLPSKTDHPPLPTNSASLKEEHVQWSSILQETLGMWKCTVIYHWTGETGLHRKSDRPRNHCRYLPLSPTPCLVQVNGNRPNTRRVRLRPSAIPRTP